MGRLRLGSGALALLLLSISALSPPSDAEREAETTRPLSVVRLRSVDVSGPASRSEARARRRQRPRLLLEGGTCSSSSAAPCVRPPPPPDPKDERWGPLSRGAQAIISFGGRGGQRESTSTSTLPPPPDALSASAAAVSAVERVGGAVSDSLPDDALLAVGLTEGALDALERDRAISWISLYEPEMKVAPEWKAVFEAGRELLAGSFSSSGGENDTADSLPSSSFSLSALPRAAAPFVYLSALRVPTVDVVVSFPALLPKSPGGDDDSSSYSPAAAAAEAWASSLGELCGSAASSTTGLPPPTCEVVGVGRDRLAVSVPLLAVVPSPEERGGAPSAEAPPLLLAEAVVSSWATRSPATHWVSPRARPRSRNAVAAGLAQSGLVPPGLLPPLSPSASSAAAAAAAAAVAASLPGAFPLWSAGIRGQGQILGMGDTGLDYDHCLFVDPNLQPPLPPTTTAPSSLVGRLPFSSSERDGTRFFSSPSHRKLVYYRALSGDSVDASGHGTHCAGTAVGSSATAGNLADLGGGSSPSSAAVPPSRRFEGMAPASKLAFTDIGSGSGGDLSVPVDLVADYFPYHYNRGARVHSDSWGSDATAYDDMASDFDRFAWLRPTFLPVVAAGNAGAGDVGASGAGGGGTVSSPAVSKNCLAVAATLTEPFDGSPEREDVSREKVTGELLVATVTSSSSASGQLSPRRSHRAVAAIFLPSSGTTTGDGPATGVGTVGGLPPLTALAVASSVSGTDWPLVAAEPLDACSPLGKNNGSSTTAATTTTTNAVVFAWRGNCSFATKAANAASAGAAALLIGNTGPGGALRMTGAVPSSPSSAVAVAPTASVSKSSADDLSSALASGKKLRVSFSRDLLRLPVSSAPPGSVSRLTATATPSSPSTFYPLPRSESIAYFSSSGPTPDGRHKPDLAAPGTTASAFSDGDPTTGNCGAGVDRGTSMATPVVAGAALLARQFFAHGWWWNSAPNATAAFEPTAALVKAVLLGGATPMRGLAPAPSSASSLYSPSASSAFDLLPLDPPPSARQGHGRLHVGRSIPLSSPVSDSSWGLAFADNVTVSQGGVVRFCLENAPSVSASASSGQPLPSPLVVTLAWTDRPASPAASSALVNDLDLEVTVPGVGGAPPTLLLGNGGSVRDSTNNVERVVVPDTFSSSSPSPGSISVVVRGRSLPLGGSQPFALAVHGAAAAARARAGLSPRLAAAAGGACASALPPLPPAITRRPPAVGNASTVSFSFEAPSSSNSSGSSSSSPVGAFECRLSSSANGSAASPSPPLFAWTRCSSPAQLRSLPDGSYVFSVRNYLGGAGSGASGSAPATSASFSVDTVAPVAEITSTSAPMPRAPRGAAFAFRAARGEASPVSFECRLDRVDGGGGGNATAATTASSSSSSPVVLLGASTLGAWEPCSSPKGYGGLGAGTWSFSVRARDAAGNAQRWAGNDARSTASWTVRLPRHARLVGASSSADDVPRTPAAPPLALGEGGSYSATFSFDAEPGDDGGGGGAGALSLAPSSSTDEFECSLSSWNATARSYSVPISPWEPCESPKTYGGLAGGGALYLFQVAISDPSPAGGGAPDGGMSSLAAATQLALGDAPTPSDAAALAASLLPVARIDAFPPRVVPTASASSPFDVAFSLDEGSAAADGFTCSLQGPLDDGSLWLAPCDSPRRLDFGAMVDGSYVFRVAAESEAAAAAAAAAGSTPATGRGPPASAAFVLDSLPPNVTSLSLYAKTTSKDGEGVANSTLLPYVDYSTSVGSKSNNESEDALALLRSLGVMPCAFSFRSKKAKDVAFAPSVSGADDGALGSGVAGAWCRLVPWASNGDAAVLLVPLPVDETGSGGGNDGLSSSDGGELSSSSSSEGPKTLLSKNGVIASVGGGYGGYGSYEGEFEEEAEERRLLLLQKMTTSTTALEAKTTTAARVASVTPFSSSPPPPPAETTEFVPCGGSATVPGVGGGNLTLTRHGLWALQAFAVDAAGNRGELFSCAFSFEKEAPKLALSPLAIAAIAVASVAVAPAAVASLVVGCRKARR